MNFNKFRQLLFDLRCILCGNRHLSADINYICDDCLKAFTLSKSSVCKICKHPLNEFSQCDSCSKLGKIYFDSYHCIQYYTDFIKTIIYKLKKEENYMIIRLFFDLIRKRGFVKNDGIITVVPDDFFKRFKKGRASLSYLLTLFKKNGYKIERNILKKRFSVFNSQKMKSGADRLKNIKRLIYTAEESESRRAGKVYLIDDVYTTGSTINYCSKLLKEAGFSEVHAVTFVRAVIKE